MPFLAGKSRLVMAALGCALAAGYVLAAAQLRTPAFSDPVGPRLVPYLIAAGLVAACVALVMEHLAKGRGRHAAAAEGQDGVTGVALLALGLLVAYYLLFERLGFIVSTGAFLFAFLSFTNRGRWFQNLTVAILFPIAAYLLLATLLGARLPAGILQAG